MTRPILVAFVALLSFAEAHAVDVQAEGNHTPLFEISRGDSGRLLIVASRDEAPEPQWRLDRIGSLGVQGEYRHGQLIWVNRQPDGGTEFGIGFKRRF